LEHSRKRYQEFLTAVMNHPELRHSEALEVFLICQTKEEFNMRVKEMDRKIKKAIKIDRMMTKRNFEYLKTGEDPIKTVKTSQGKIDFKISKTVRSYYEEFLNKINCYETTFQEIEILSGELTKLMDKVGRSNNRQQKSRVVWKRNSVNWRRYA
jgi:hypothetical protein